ALALSRLVCRARHEPLLAQLHVARLFYRRPADFFFQAEDGIRGRNVTGVQTCALPICSRENQLVRWHWPIRRELTRNSERLAKQIGRASCRERAWIPVDTGSGKNKTGTQYSSPTVRATGSRLAHYYIAHVEAPQMVNTA